MNGIALLSTDGVFGYDNYWSRMRLVIAISILVSIASAQTAPKSAAASFDTLARKADAAREQDRLDEATGLYRQALRLKPSWAEGWWSLGTILYDSDHHAECAAAFTRFVALKPDVGPAHALLGLCEFGRGQYDAALRHLFRAQDLGFAGDDRIRSVALYHTGLALIVNQNFERAVEQLALVVAAGPPPAPVRTAVGLAILRRPLLPDAVPEPDRPLVTRVGDAMVAQLERRPDDAARLFEAILADYPQAPEIRYAFGSLLLNANPEKALAMLKSELEISPGHVPALAAIAYEYLKENEGAAALPYAEKAARLAPSDFAARTAYGRALLELGRIPEAIQELETAVKLAPDSPHARFSLAAAYVRAGRNEDADRERKEFARLRKLIDSGRK
jgi:tetratricopeptide (TPR) repeat protein